jgi:hypothetical protein
MKNQNAMIVSGGICLLGLWLLSTPNCRRGCRTVAEHLLEHGLQDFFTALFA